MLSYNPLVQSPKDLEESLRILDKNLYQENLLLPRQYWKPIFLCPALHVSRYVLKRIRMTNIWEERSKKGGGIVSLLEVFVK